MTVTAEEWAEVFRAGREAIPGRSEPAANALALALGAMEDKAREIPVRVRVTAGSLEDVPPGITRLLARLLRSARAEGRISVGGAADAAGLSAGEIETLLRVEPD